MFQILRHFTTTPPPTPAKESNLDIDMVIILMGLLCALVGTVIVNLILRCVWRQGSSAAGVEKGKLEEIPVAVFGGEGGVRIRGKECTICLGEFENGDDLRILPKCNHGFHVHCIDAWLLSHSFCPNCRHSLPLKMAADCGQGRGELPRSGSHLPHAGQISGDIIIFVTAI